MNKKSLSSRSLLKLGLVFGLSTAAFQKANADDMWLISSEPRICTTNIEMDLNSPVTIGPKETCGFGPSDVLEGVVGLSGNRISVAIPSDVGKASYLLPIIMPHPGTPHREYNSNVAFYDPREIKRIRIIVRTEEDGIRFFNLKKFKQDNRLDFELVMEPVQKTATVVFRKEYLQQLSSTLRTHGSKLNLDYSRKAQLEEHLQYVQDISNQSSISNGDMDRFFNAHDKFLKKFFEASGFEDSQKRQFFMAMIEDLEKNRIDPYLDTPAGDTLRPLKQSLAVLKTSDVNDPEFLKEFNRIQREVLNAPYQQIQILTQEKAALQKENAELKALNKNQAERIVLLEKDSIEFKKTQGDLTKVRSREADLLKENENLKKTIDALKKELAKLKETDPSLLPYREVVNKYATNLEEDSRLELLILKSENKLAEEASKLTADEKQVLRNTIQESKEKRVKLKPIIDELKLKKETMEKELRAQGKI